MFLFQQASAILSAEPFEMRTLYKNLNDQGLPVTVYPRIYDDLWQQEDEIATKAVRIICDETRKTRKKEHRY